ncbi:MAG: hypothetical protein ABSC87_06215 [Halobacteriota archaeon]
MRSDKIKANSRPRECLKANTFAFRWTLCSMFKSPKIEGIVDALYILLSGGTIRQKYTPLLVLLQRERIVERT